MAPPKTLDGAEVVLWAWSGSEPFFVMLYRDKPGGIPIFGLAICRYRDSGSIYRFSCDANWVVQNDAPFRTVENAKAARNARYDTSSVRWLPV